MVSHYTKISIGLTITLLAFMAYYIPHHLLSLPPKSFGTFHKFSGQAAAASLFFSIAVFPLTLAKTNSLQRFSPATSLIRKLHPSVGVFSTGLALIHGLSIINNFRYNGRFLSGIGALSILLLIVATGFVPAWRRKTHLPLNLIFFFVLIIHIVFPQIFNFR